MYASTWNKTSFNMGSNLVEYINQPMAATHGHSLILIIQK